MEDLVSWRQNCITGEHRFFRKTETEEEKLLNKCRPVLENSKAISVAVGFAEVITIPYDMVLKNTLKIIFFSLFWTPFMRHRKVLDNNRQVSKLCCYQNVNHALDRA